MARGPGEPRVRYIALRVTGDAALTRRQLIDAIHQTGREQFGAGFEKQTGTWLTRYNGSYAIVRCHHTHQEPTRNVLDHVTKDPQGRTLELTSLGTSGTIRGLVEKHVPTLKEPVGAKRHEQNKQKNRTAPRPSRDRDRDQNHDRDRDRDRDQNRNRTQSPRTRHTAPGRRR